MKPECYLLMDTSTKNFSLAVSRAGRVARFRNFYLDQVLSSSIIPCIDRILKRADISFDDISGFGVGLGPGSFTSLRVGLATIKAFCLASGKPVAGVPSPDILVRNVAPAAIPYAATLVDARRDLVYACLYRATSRGWERASPYLLTDLEAFLPRLEGDTVFLGDAVPRYAGRIQEFMESRSGPRGPRVCRWAPEKLWVPRAGRMLDLVSERLKEGRGDAPDTLVPLYLYPEDCQVRR